MPLICYNSPGTHSLILRPSQKASSLRMAEMVSQLWSLSVSCITSRPCALLPQTSSRCHIHVRGPQRPLKRRAPWKDRNGGPAVASALALAKATQNMIAAPFQDGD